MKTPEERKQSSYEYKHKLYNDRKAWGVCVICGKRMMNGESTIVCDICLKKRRDWAAPRREILNRQRREFAARHKAMGLCAYCNSPAVEGITLCEYHRSYYKELNKKRCRGRKSESANNAKE
jgi:GT2 family glycosyltransferase